MGKLFTLTEQSLWFFCPCSQSTYVFQQSLDKCMNTVFIEFNVNACRTMLGHFIFAYLVSLVMMFQTKILKQIHQVSFED